MSGDPRAEEARAFAEFEAAVAAVPRERMEEAVLPDGWTVKDVLWHVAYWWGDGERTFRAIAAGTHTGFDDDEETDVANARVLEESRSRSLQEVEAELGAVRGSFLAAFAPVAGDATAVELFRSETIEHYEEHLPAVRTLGA
jgi:Mycothiol maleylpyruvate isomerase N-terminal domain